ncbi:MAG: transcriptional regulator, Crp/Fnr family [Ramlibacter sp.]|nr:transcriptional regulator, Crp/Fnr family [Ramlibacter sp.]MDB5912785.1 transcriptional regulator, Crp/Fnr family [Ramlibacter sp.]
MVAPAQMSFLGLARNPMLSELPPDRLSRLAAQCRWKRFAAGQVIVSRHAPSGDVHLIVDGRVRIHVYSSDGREVLFTHTQEGGIVGDLAAVDGGLRTADAHASSAVLCATLSAEDFRQLLHEERSVEEKYVRYLVGLVRSLTNHVIELSTLGVQNRIRAEMLRLAQGQAEAGQAKLQPAPRHADLAARVGTSREQVTRELSALTRQGLLQKSGGALLVTDVRGLQALVHGAPATAVPTSRAPRTAPRGEQYRPR